MYTPPVSGWRLNAELGIRREPIRAPENRQPGFENEYDYLTIIYDVFLDMQRDRIMIISPALRNLFDKFSNSEFLLDWVRSTPSFFTLDRCCRTILPMRAGAPILTIRGGLGSVDLEIQPDYTAIFAGHCVIYTLSKNNELDWIRDWVRYNSKIHGCNAVLIYDNLSTTYSVNEVYECVMAVPGIRQAVVMSWPFPYGPGGGPAGIWDSDYCQYGALEHARWRFLQKAAGVINSDIDELVVTRPDKPLFDIIEDASTGYLSYPGVWISNARVDSIDSAEVRYHRNYCCKEIKPPQCPRKWIVNPNLCPEEAQWLVHAVTYMPEPLSRIWDIYYGHFRAINTNWKYKRVAQEQFHPEKHLRDEDLRAALMAAFGA
jgi:hypothetical protein